MKKTLTALSGRLGGGIENLGFRARGTSLAIVTGSVILPLRRCLLFPTGYALAGALLAIGCALQGFDAPRGVGPLNQCGGDEECGEGAVCSEVGSCVAQRNFSLPLLLEVTPPAGTSRIGGVSFSQSVILPDAEHDGLDIRLGFVSRIQGTIGAEPVAEGSCVERPGSGDVLGDVSIQSARITLIPRKRLLGLPEPPRTVEFEGSNAKFALSAPPGTYDLYIEPLDYGGGCARPPELFINQSVLEGDVSLPIQLATPERVELKVQFPGPPESLEGWTLDIVEPESGRLLSTRATLGSASVAAGLAEYRVAVAFAPSVGRERSEVVRLSPPTSVTAPTVFIGRAVAELFQSDGGVISQLTNLPKLARVGGRVTRRGSLTGAPSTLTFIAQSLDTIGAGISAAFSIKVVSDEEGRFSVEMPPGTYRVVAEPEEFDLAQTETKIVVGTSNSEQLGKTIELEKRRKVMGELLSFSGGPASGVPVQAMPPPEAKSSSVFDLAAGNQVFLPGAESGSSDNSGRFELWADAGRFDLLVRPETSLGFPWSIRLAVEVGDGEVQLGRFTLPAPIVLRGDVSSDDIGPVPSALVRAYAYVKSGRFSRSAEDADYVVPVGEARVGSDGAYRLLLPPELP